MSRALHRLVLASALVGISAAAPACLLQEGPAAEAEQPTQVIDFLYEDNRLYLPVRIKGSAPRWFILDTGASPTVVDSAFAADVGMVSQGDNVVTGAGAGSSRSSDGEAIDLFVGGVPMRVARPAVAELAKLLGPTSGRLVSGIIGSQFFKEHYVEIDFDRKKISLFPPKVDRSRWFERSVPLTFYSNVPLAPLTLALPSGRSLRANVLVDLGAKSTLLIPEPYIDAHKLRADFPKSITMGLGAGVGGDTRYAFGRARRIAFADAPEMGTDDPVLGLSVDGTLKSNWNDGLLGAEFLSRFRLGFDYARSRMLLSLKDKARPNFDMSGMFLVAQGDGLKKVTVREVLKGGPAEKAGLAAGDQIVRVEGRDTSEIGLLAVREMLKAGAGKHVSIIFRRGLEQREARLQLQALL